jgi:hypothetical protein
LFLKARIIIIIIYSKEPKGRGGCEKEEGVGVLVENIEALFRVNVVDCEKDA